MRTIKAKFEIDDRGDFNLIYDDPDLKVWSNPDHDGIWGKTFRRYEKILDWVMEKLSDKDWDKLNLGEKIEIDVPFSKIDYEIRDKETDKMVKRPSVNRLREFMNNPHRTIEPDHPDSPLRKMGLI